ncbi:MAG: cupin domain-containing protein [Acidobacteria bacterium]|nr:cupin domain-containing protein [Acidobacteriota bacterium]MBV9477105.1 cupin domain-containing protein [Acidobacteriota bacterium]
MHALLALLFAIQITTPVWNDAPPSMPAGTKIAILEGSPREPGMFTIRLKLPKGAVVPPHTHPRPERVTVLSGRVRIAFATKIGAHDASTTFTTGGFYVNPPNEAHYLLIDEETVLQLTCEGPWELKYVK